MRYVKQCVYVCIYIYLSKATAKRQRRQRQRKQRISSRAYLIHVGKCCANRTGAKCDCKETICHVLSGRIEQAGGIKPVKRNVTARDRASDKLLLFDRSFSTVQLFPPTLRRRRFTVKRERVARSFPNSHSHDRKKESGKIISRAQPARHLWIK